MLNTLIKLGKQLSEERGEWDDIIDFPNIAVQFDICKRIKTSQARLLDKIMVLFWQ